MPRDYDEEDPEYQEEEEQPEEEEEQPEEEPTEEADAEGEEEEVEWAYSTCQGNKKAVFVSGMCLPRQLRSLTPARTDWH